MGVAKLVYRLCCSVDKPFYKKGFETSGGKPKISKTKIFELWEKQAYFLFFSILSYSVSVKFSFLNCLISSNKPYSTKILAFDCS